MNNLKIAAAVALALGGASTAYATAATPTLAQCQAAPEVLYVAGSSAAQNAFANALNNDLFGGGAATYTASNGNFKAYCGFSQVASVEPVGTVIVVHYRAEGGSVVGALPIVSGKAIKFLDLSQATQGSLTVSTGGSSASVGTSDGWTGGVTSHVVEMGITDVEPGQLVGSNYPSAYSPSAFGTATPALLSGLTKKPLFDQVFGLFVNTTGFNNTGSGGAGQPVDLSRETAAAVLTGGYTDWSHVPTASGGVVSSTPAAIYVENREPGSGTRTGASIYFLGYNCSQTTTGIAEASNYTGPNGPTDYYQTSDALGAASGQPGAITYASIDNAGKPNLTTVSLSGVAPSNLAATSGTYDWWYEAQLIKGALQPADLPLYNFLVTELSSVNTTPHVADILAIPGAGSPINKSTRPLTANMASAGAPIYVNPFTRSGNSCNVPSTTNGP